MKIRYFFPVVLVTLACSAAQKLANMPTGSPEPASTLPTMGLTQESPGPELTSMPTLAATPVFECLNAPKTQLKVGDTARVASTEGPSLRLRRDPVVDDKNILKLIPEGTKIEIIDGPICFPDPKTGTAFVFWKISIPGDPLKGWVAEGDAKEYFIEPLP